MFKKIITGQTGCGKTYHTINEAKKLGKFVYLAPCRQLVYEVFIDYSNVSDQLSTGEVKMGELGGNFFGVYESLNLDRIKNYNSIIIDEAHFITDVERGGHLVELISQAEKDNLNIFLVTATKNFRKLKGFEIVELKPIKKPPIKKQISYQSYIARKNAGIPTLQFSRYKGDAMMSADTTPSYRLQLQLDYRAGKISFVSATNVLAQGLNMPCENLLIEHNPYDGDEVLHQKLGRLGRMGFCQSKEVTYCISYKPEKIKANKPKAKIINRDIEIAGWGEPFIIPAHTVPYFYHEKIGTTRINIRPGGSRPIPYSSVRYSRPFLERAILNKLNERQAELCETALEVINSEADKVASIINNLTKLNN